MESGNVKVKAEVASDWDWHPCGAVVCQVISKQKSSTPPEQSKIKLKPNDIWSKETPGEKNVDPCVGGDNCNERQKEDLAVKHHVVDVRPVVRADKKSLK